MQFNNFRITIAMHRNNSSLIIILIKISIIKLKRYNMREMI